jgi:hypothetical protein
MRHSSSVHRARLFGRILHVLATATVAGCDLLASPPITADAGLDAAGPTGAPEEPDRCLPSDCGGNSPVINGFPIDGLHAAGVANHEGFALVRGSVRGGACDGGSLDVDDEADELVVRGADDAVRCRGADVEGITFAVGLAGNQPRRIAIALVERYESATVPGLLRWKYRLVAADGEQPARASLCDRDEAATWRAGWARAPARRGQPFDRYEPSGGAAAAAAAAGGRGGSGGSDALDTSDLIAFHAESYDEDAHPTAWPRPGFFHLACARDALAKLDLDRIAPHRADPDGDADDDADGDADGDADDDADGDYLQTRAAALKAMTANFCDQARYTTDGRELIRVPYAACTYLGVFSPAHCGIERVEAVWDERGALCISSTRLLQSHRRPVRASLFPRCHGADGREHECRTEQELVESFHQLCSGVLDRPVGTCAPTAYPGARFVTGIVR